MWHVLQSDAADNNNKSDSGGQLLSVERSRSRSNSGVLNIPKDFDPKMRAKSVCSKNVCSKNVCSKKMFVRKMFV
jgi:hypothetical protein